MQKMLGNKLLIFVFMAPALFLYSAVIPYPIVKSVVYSFFKWDIVGKLYYVGLDNFARLFTRDYIFFTALKNTFVFTIGSILLQIPLAFLLASVVVRLGKLTKLFRNVYFLPCTISAAAVSLLWQFIYHPNMGILNTALRGLGLERLTHTWLADPRFALYAVIVSVAWQWFGYHMVIFLTGITSVPDSIFESAEIEGATGFKMIRYITFPLLKPFVKISLVLITTSSIKAFDNIYVLTGGGPAHASDVLALQMYQKAFTQMEYGYGSAISVVLLVLCIALTVILNKLFAQNPVEF
ncbi:MAG: sugar ABC transporter permease [Firmicutes bacterium]|nr:sugar ABC transporter permease [Bacillota bacterium]